MQRLLQPGPWPKGGVTLTSFFVFSVISVLRPLRPLVLSLFLFLTFDSLFLFGAEGEDGIDGGGSACGQVAGKESNAEQQKTRGYDGGQVARGKSKEHAGDKPSRRKAGGNANGDAEQSQRKRFAHNHPTNTSLLRAKGDANGDFARAARNA